MAIAARLATAVLGLWLAVLILGGLGLQPLGGIPIAGGLGGGNAAPPALPKRVHADVARHSSVPRAAAAPARHVARATARSHRPAATPSPRGDTRATPTGGHPHTKGTLRPGPTSPLPSPAPSPTRSPPPARSHPQATAPGQTRTAPGQTKTTPGPPAITPGGTPGGNTHGNGHSPNAKTQ
jgi:hypothetical protein